MPVHVPIRKPLIKVTLGNFKGQRAQKARVKYVIAVLQGATDAQAKKAANLKHRATRSRIIDKLRCQGNLRDAPRLGHARTYTEEHMEAAVDILAEQDEATLTGVHLLQIMKDRGLIHQDASASRFLEHLHRHVQAQGYRLVTNHRRTTFFLTKQDVKERAAFAREMVQKLNDYPLEKWIFADESELSEYCHPKGDLLDGKEMNRHACCAEYGVLAVNIQTKCQAEGSNIILAVTVPPVFRVVTCAGAKSAPGYLFIPGITREPQRQHTDARHMRKVCAAVAIHLGSSVLTMETSGTEYDGQEEREEYPYKQSTRKHKQGDPMKAMGKEEYGDFLEGVVQKIRKKKGLGKCTLVLVHDRSKVHQSEHVKKLLRRLNVVPVLIPPRSPDLDPLDYGVFGTAKHLVPRRGPWEERASAFMHALKEMDVSATIKQYPMRLQDCLDCEGGHLHGPFL